MYNYIFIKVIYVAKQKDKIQAKSNMRTSVNNNVNKKWYKSSVSI